MAVWNLDAATGAVTGSPQLNRLLGFPEGEVLDAEAIRARYAPGEHERLSAEGAAALAHGKTSNEAEFRCQHPENGLRWLRLRYDAIFDGEGVPIRVIGVMSDETEQRQAEVRVRANGNLLAEVVDPSLGVLERAGHGQNHGLCRTSV